MNLAMILIALHSFHLTASFGLKKQAFPLFIASNLLKATFMASTSAVNTCDSSDNDIHEIDPLYPGTAVYRMKNIHCRVKSLNSDQLNNDWENVRRNILWAGGLKDLPSNQPGQGYTGHSFNDFNHCDLTPMRDDEAENENGGRVAGIHTSNKLGAGIKIASLSEVGPGGSWSTCMMGCSSDPPKDVAHIQFKSRIAFKLVWVPPAYKSFVLVDDDGALLNEGTPTGFLPDLEERKMNYQLVRNSKYSKIADERSHLIF